MNQIKNITYQIEKIYESLIELEINNDYKSYQNKLEELKLYLELENKYYLELKQKIMNSKSFKNNILEEISFSFEFNFEGMYPLDNFYYVENTTGLNNKKNLRERRIYSHLVSILNDLENPEQLLKNLLQQQIIVQNNKDYVFPLGVDQIYIYDRSKALIQLLEETSRQLYLNYLYLLQGEIDNKKIFWQEMINHKYQLCFISPNLEKNAIDDSFNISKNNIEESFFGKNKLEERIKEYYLSYISMDVFLELLDNLLQYNDNDFLEENPNREIMYYYFILERLFWKTSLITIDSNLIQEYINELSLIENNDNQNVLNSLIRAIKK